MALVFLLENCSLSTMARVPVPINGEKCDYIYKSKINLKGPVHFWGVDVMSNVNFIKFSHLGW